MKTYIYLFLGFLLFLVCSVDDLASSSGVIEKWVPIHIQNNRIIGIGDYILDFPVCFPNNIKPAESAYLDYYGSNQHPRSIYFFVYFHDYQNDNILKFIKTDPKYLFHSSKFKADKSQIIDTISHNAGWSYILNGSVNHQEIRCFWSSYPLEGKHDPTASWNKPNSPVLKDNRLIELEILMSAKLQRK
jgi:hypothetical protein